MNRNINKEFDDLCNDFISKHDLASSTFCGLLAGSLIHHASFVSEKNFDYLLEGIKQRFVAYRKIRGILTDREEVVDE